MTSEGARLAGRAAEREMADKPSMASWLDRLIASQERRGLTSPFGDLLPGFPPADLQRMTTGLEGEATLRPAGAFYADVLEALHRQGRGIACDWRVLDFGCGWGRISRFFLRDIPLANLFGIDVDPEFIALTRRLFSSDTFSACSAFPPTAFAPGSFDLIVAYSVFSHLSENAALQWIAEFARLLRPRGVLAFTTRHESFLDYCDWLRRQPDTEGYSAALGALFPDIEAVRARYRRGELVHATSPGVAGGGARNGTFYGETLIPPDYVARTYGPWFETIFTSFDPLRYDQTCFVLRLRP